MRVRSVLTMTLAGLLLGACGSSAHSGAPETSTTTRTKSISASRATSTTGAASSPVTDLNGHAVVGVKAKDVSAENVPDKPLDRGTHAVRAEQLVEARTVAMRYPTVADATAA